MTFAFKHLDLHIRAEHLKIETCPCHGKVLASRIAFEFSWCERSIKGENMTFTMKPGQSVPVIGSPVKADGSPSTATLSGVSYSSSDPAVFTVSPDPAVPNGAIVQSVGPGSATLTETAIATEPDGTVTEKITGSATIIIATPPPAPAAAIVFTFGTPTP